MSASPRPDMLFRTGLMVADLETSCRVLGAELGGTWTPVMGMTQHVRTQQG
jgi:hypothetical protein